MKAKDQMTLEQKVKVMKEVSEAVHAAHRLGMIHRDIKPANIMVEKTEDGGWRPYVMDFGLVRDIESEGITVTGAVMGTPAYMAPEQAQGQEVDFRADLFSFGVVMYEMATGSNPFEGANIAVCDKNLAGAEATAKEITRSGGQAVAIEVDVTNAGQVDAMVEQVILKFLRELQKEGKL